VRYQWVVRRVVPLGTVSSLFDQWRAVADTRADELLEPVVEKHQDLIDKLDELSSVAFDWRTVQNRCSKSWKRGSHITDNLPVCDPASSQHGESIQT
jgi:hypothetical protein